MNDFVERHLGEERGLRPRVSVFWSVKWANTHAARNKGMVRLYPGGGGPLFLKGCPRLTDVSMGTGGLGYGELCISPVGGRGGYWCVSLKSDSNCRRAKCFLFSLNIPDCFASTQKKHEISILKTSDNGPGLESSLQDGKS